MQQLTVALILLALASGVSAGLGCNHNNCQACTADPLCGWNGSACKSRILGGCRGDGGLINGLLLCNPYQCSTAPPVYNENFAKQLWQLQGAGKVATSDPGFAGCVNAADPSAKFIARINVTCGVPLPIDRCVTDLYVLPGSKTIAAISLGSEGTSQLVQVLGALTLSFLDLQTGAVIYWQTAFNSLWNGGLQSNLTALLQNSTYADYTFVSSGHSLGGAVSLLITKAVADKGWRGPDAIQTITFGQPRLGSVALQNSIYQKAPHHFRLKNARDAISSLPFQAAWIEHSKFPVYYPIGMNSTGLAAKIICQTNEDPACTTLFQVSDLGLNYHNTYFNIDNIETWHNTNCAY
ncbi:unnamed protein product, partial [Mesorhabditis spiculigera]